jgi:hypothetical protein
MSRRCFLAVVSGRIADDEESSMQPCGPSASLDASAPSVGEASRAVRQVLSGSSDYTFV